MLERHSVGQGARKKAPHNEAYNDGRKAESSPS